MIFKLYYNWAKYTTDLPYPLTYPLSLVNTSNCKRFVTKFLTKHYDEFEILTNNIPIQLQTNLIDLKTQMMWPNVWKHIQTIY